MSVLAFLRAPSAQMHRATAARRFSPLSLRLRTSERRASVLCAGQSYNTLGSSRNMLERCWFLEVTYTLPVREAPARGGLI